MLILLLDLIFSVLLKTLSTLITVNFNNAKRHSKSSLSLFLFSILKIKYAPNTPIIEPKSVPKKDKKSGYFVKITVLKLDELMLIKITIKSKSNFKINTTSSNFYIVLLLFSAFNYFLKIKL